MKVKDLNVRYFKNRSKRNMQGGWDKEELEFTIGVNFNEGENVEDGKKRIVEVIKKWVADDLIDEGFNLANWGGNKGLG